VAARREARVEETPQSPTQTLRRRKGGERNVRKLEGNIEGKRETLVGCWQAGENCGISGGIRVPEKGGAISKEIGEESDGSEPPRSASKKAGRCARTERCFRWISQSFYVSERASTRGGAWGRLDRVYRSLKGENVEFHILGVKN